MKKTIGIMGGMGPAATIDLFQKIVNMTPAKSDQEHIHLVIDSYAQTPDRTAFIFDNSKEDPLPHMLKSAKLLENAGVDTIAIACNTAHFFLPKLQELIKIPFISLIDTTINAIKNDYPKAKNICILGTTGTKKARIYEDKIIASGLNVYELKDNLMDDLMETIYSGVKKNKTKEYTPLFQSIIDELESDIKPDILISACTEVPMLMENAKVNIPVVDPTLELAKAIIKFAG